MDIHRAEISESLIDTLADYRNDVPLFSLYMPVTLQWEQAKKNEIRLKNLVASARRQLEEIEYSAEDIEQWLKSLQRALASDELWSEPGAGLAVFVNNNAARVVTLPFRANEMCYVGPRFHIKPLFAALRYVGRYGVLALSKNRVRIFAGDGFGLAELDPGERVPESLTDVTGVEVTERQLQHHAGDRGSGAAIFHGHGGGKDDSDAEVAQFLRALDAALGRVPELRDAPLVLAGVNPLVASFRQLSDWPDLVEQSITGNVEHLSPGELHDRAWPAIRDRIDMARAETLERLSNGAPDAGLSQDIGDILRNAIDGRIETICVAEDAECWGRFDEVERRVDLHRDREPGDSDLLDRAALESFRRGGDVYLARRDDIPGGNSIAALRY